MMGNGKKTKNMKARMIPYCDHFVNTSFHVLVNGTRMADNVPISMLPE